MMKAILLFSTILLNPSLGDLPKLNSPVQPEGKCIKAHTLHACDFTKTDTSDLLLVPHVHFEKSPGSYHVKTVVIDPGHGGHDPGCLGAHSREKHVALAIGKELAEKIKNEHPGVNVIMTRSEDVFVPLHERADIATRNKADLFISIHCNAFSKGEARGIETYVLGLHATKANLEVAKRENEAILLEDNYQETYGYDPNSTEAHIMMSMFQNAFLEQSISFAEKVQSNAVVETRRKNRGVKQAGFLVLRHATMPSVLVETGYLTNRGDEDYLVTDKGQNEMAQAILLAFSEYKYEMENGTSITTEPLPQKQSGPVVQYNAPSKKEMEGPKAQAIKVKQEEAVPPLPAPKKQSKRTMNLVISPPVNAEKKIPGEEKKEEVVNVAEPEKEVKKSKIIAAKPLAAPASTIPENEDAEPVINFCVQLAASPKLLNVNSGKWSRVEQTVEVIEEGRLYKYQIRHFKSMADADRVRQQLRSKGFSDSFIVAYKNGEKVDPKTLQ